MIKSRGDSLDFAYSYQSRGLLFHGYLVIVTLLFTRHFFHNTGSKDVQTYYSSYLLCYLDNFTWNWQQTTLLQRLMQCLR